MSKTCSKCGIEIDDNSEFCIECGNKGKHNSSYYEKKIYKFSLKSVLKALLIIILAVFVIGIFTNNCQ